MTIRSALKKLYTSMCGGTTDAQTAGDLINAIADDYTGGGGSDLPTPGTAGNVLTSTGSEWESAAPSGAMIIEGTMGDGTVTITTTPADIKDAYDAGKPVYLRFMNAAAPCVSAYGDGDDVIVDFVGTYFGENDDEAYLVGVKFDGSLTGTMEFLDTRPDVPTSSASENGKVLGISNGEYTFVDTKYPLILTGTEGENNAITISGATLAEIYAAATAGKLVYLDVAFTAFGGANTRLPLVLYSYDNDEYAYGFSIALPVTTNGMIVCATFENSLTGTIETKTWSVT